MMYNIYMKQKWNILYYETEDNKCPFDEFKKSLKINEKL